MEAKTGPSPRLCHLIKWPDLPDEYAFNVHGEKGKSGQYIGKVDANSPAELAGLREGDRIIEVNSVNISNESHRQVVERIKSIPNETKLLVVDELADKWYKERKIVVKSTQSNVIHYKTPVPRPINNNTEKPSTPPTNDIKENESKLEVNGDKDSDESTTNEVKTIKAEVNSQTNGGPETPPILTMATGFDTTQIQSLVIFNEIRPVYSLYDDIECRFYVDPSLDCSLDKIGLYRIGWTHKQDFIVIKDVHNCATDEFDERRLVFPVTQISEDTTRDDIEYQFCYFHPFGDKKSYQLCGRSESFRFSKSISHSSESGRDVSPSAPEMSIRYPNLEMENLDINQTNPKRLYDLNDNDFNDLFQDNQRYSTPKGNRRSIDWEIEAKKQELLELEERLVQQNTVKDLEIERVTKNLRSAQRKVSSLEYELQTKIENEDKFEEIHNELTDTIRLAQTKNSSLEEQLLLRDNDIKGLNAQCSAQEKTIDELRHKLAISHSELELYYTQTIESIGLDDHRNHDLKQENRLLKDKLQEVMQMSEKLKETNDRLFREKRDLDKTKLKIQSELEGMRQNCAHLKSRLDDIEGEDRFDVRHRAEDVLVRGQADITGNKQPKGQSHQITVNELLTDCLNTSITIIANEMTEEVKDYCLDQTSEALNRYSDVKSMADSIVYAMDDRFGNSWHCFIGRDFSHNSLLHVFGTYFSFSVNGLKIIIYKSADMPDSCQVIRWAKESPNVDIIFKTEYTDNDFEDFVVNTVMDLVKEEFTDYSELSAHITKELNSKYGPKYGHNWFAICGESDRFYSNLLLFSKKYKSIELEINCLKVIVIQFDEKIIENTNSLFNFKSFGNRK